MKLVFLCGGIAEFCFYWVTAQNGYFVRSNNIPVHHINYVRSSLAVYYVSCANMQRSGNAFECQDIHRVLFDLNYSICIGTRLPCQAGF